MLVGVLPIREALAVSAQHQLDLIEIAPGATPPVCKIMDFGKYKYELKKKQAEAKKHQAVVSIKEVKLGFKTEEHDISYRKLRIKEFLEDGDKVKISMRFRGREVVYKEIGEKLFLSIIDELKDFAAVEQPPKQEGMILSMILIPAKRGSGRGE